MRPVRRGNSPIASDYSDYTQAKSELISHIGSGWSDTKHIASYCSYCERKIDTNLALEHIEPKKGLYGKPHLQGEWTNFLLACVNCNSTKKDKEVLLDQLFLPDRDNTFYAFEYLADGTVTPASNLSTKNKEIADATLSLTGLDKALRKSYDAAGNLIAQGRASQRIQVWGIAESSLDDYLSSPSSVVKKLILKNMVLSSFFSVWMTVFKDHQDMKLLFIRALHGTEESGCFDLCSGDIITPHPNVDNLNGGGKI